MQKKTKTELLRVIEEVKQHHEAEINAFMIERAELNDKINELNEIIEVKDNMRIDSENRLINFKRKYENTYNELFLLEEENDEIHEKCTFIKFIRNLF